MWAFWNTKRNCQTPYINKFMINKRSLWRNKNTLSVWLQNSPLLLIWIIRSWTAYALVLILPTFQRKFQICQKLSDFNKVLQSDSTPKGAPVCALASNSYDWDLRNIAKVSSKMTKNGHFLKSCLYDSIEVFYLIFLGSFLFSPPPQNFFWKISENLITNRLEYKPESFNFKFILRVIV